MLTVPPDGRVAGLETVPADGRETVDVGLLTVVLGFLVGVEPEAGLDTEEGLDTVPVERDAEPVERDTVPVEREVEPVERDTVPVEREVELVERDTVPVERDVVPDERDTAPDERDTDPDEEVDELRVAVPEDLDDVVFEEDD